MHGMEWGGPESPSSGPSTSVQSDLVCVLWDVPDVVILIQTLYRIESLQDSVRWQGLEQLLLLPRGSLIISKKKKELNLR